MAQNTPSADQNTTTRHGIPIPAIALKDTTTKEGRKHGDKGELVAARPTMVGFDKDGHLYASGGAPATTAEATSVKDVASDTTVTLIPTFAPERRYNTYWKDVVVASRHRLFSSGSDLRYTIFGIPFQPCVDFQKYPFHTGIRLQVTNMEGLAGQRKEKSVCDLWVGDEIVVRVLQPSQNNQPSSTIQSFLIAGIIVVDPTFKLKEMAEPIKPAQWKVCICKNWRLPDVFADPERPWKYVEFIGPEVLMKSANNKSSGFTHVPHSTMQENDKIKSMSICTQTLPKIIDFLVHTASQIALPLEEAGRLRTLFVPNSGNDTEIPRDLFQSGKSPRVNTSSKKDASATATSSSISPAIDSKVSAVPSSSSSPPPILKLKLKPLLSPTAEVKVTSTKKQVKRKGPGPEKAVVEEEKGEEYVKAYPNAKVTEAEKRLPLKAVYRLKQMMADLRSRLDKESSAHLTALSDLRKATTSSQKETQFLKAEILEKDKEITQLKNKVALLSEACKDARMDVAGILSGKKGEVPVSLGLESTIEAIMGRIMPLLNSRGATTPQDSVSSPLPSQIVLAPAPEAAQIQPNQASEEHSDVQGQGLSTSSPKTREKDKVNRRNSSLSRSPTRTSHHAGPSSKKRHLSPIPCSLGRSSSQSSSPIPSRDRSTRRQHKRARHQSRSTSSSSSVSVTERRDRRREKEDQGSHRHKRDGHRSHRHRDKREKPRHSSKRDRRGHHEDSSSQDSRSSNSSADKKEKRQRHRK